MRAVTETLMGPAVALARVVLAMWCGLATPVWPVAWGGPTEVYPDEVVRVGEVDRRFRLIVPRGAGRARPVPLVVAFHGMLIDSKDRMPEYTGLGELAAEEGFLLAFPGALDGSWGLTPDKVRADLAFFDALVAELGVRYRIDPMRVYVLGMSNGGYFAHLVGKERSRVVAAVCSHSGPLGLQALLGVGAERKFPVMIVHGAEDRLFPVEVARANRDSYRSEGHRVRFVEIPGLGHGWGGREEINGQIWAFFEANPLR